MFPNFSCSYGNTIVTHHLSWNRLRSVESDTAGSKVVDEGSGRVQGEEEAELGVSEMLVVHEMRGQGTEASFSIIHHQTSYFAPSIAEDGVASGTHDEIREAFAKQMMSM